MFGNKKRYEEKVKKKILKRLYLIEKIKKKIKSEFSDIKIEKMENKIEKIKGGIKKMVGKLQLKDGKIVKQEDVVEELKQESTMPFEQEVQQPVPNVEQRYQPPQFAANRIEPQEVVQPMLQQPNYMQESIPQQANYMQANIPQEMSEPQFINQPQIPPQPQKVSVNIVLSNNVMFDISMNGNVFEQFVRETQEAIDNQSSIQIGNKFINGRHIIMFEY